jgi:hypothetical protein
MKLFTVYTTFWAGNCPPVCSYSRTKFAYGFWPMLRDRPCSCPHTSRGPTVVPSGHRLHRTILWVLVGSVSALFVCLIWFMYVKLPWQAEPSIIAQLVWWYASIMRLQSTTIYALLYAQAYKMYTSTHTHTHTHKHIHSYTHRWLLISCCHGPR